MLIAHSVTETVSIARSDRYNSLCMHSCQLEILNTDICVLYVFKKHEREGVLEFRLNTFVYYLPP
jgi:hypothetical protein